VLVSLDSSLARTLGSALLVGLAGAATGCTAYRPELVRTPAAADRAPAPPTEALTFDRALVLMVERNPELRALGAEARGVNLRPYDAELRGILEVEDDRVMQATLGTDVLALLGIGPRPAQRALASAMRYERLAMRLERTRELAGELAVAFAALGELDALVATVTPLDVSAYRRAGLAAPSDATESAAARIGWGAEREIVALEARRHRLTIARLIGSGPEHDVQVLPPSASWPRVPAPDERALLYARADLQRLAAALAVADREARLAAARQWPNVGIDFGAVFDPTDPFGMLEVSLPLAAAGEARAALARRDAARLALEAGVLAARHDAAQAQIALTEADANLRYAQGMWDGRHAAVRAARLRASIDTKDLSMAVRMEGEEIESARDLREARLMRARARVEAAVAAGWPSPHAKSVDQAPRGGQMWGSE
jgi:hypothetical protein